MSAVHPFSFLSQSVAVRESNVRAIGSSTDCPYLSMLIDERYAMTGMAKVMNIVNYHPVLERRPTSLKSALIQIELDFLECVRTNGEECIAVRSRLMVQ